MARNSHLYVCQSCGGTAPKWSGRCDACGAWNTLVEEAIPMTPGLPRARGLSGKTGALTLVSLAGTIEAPPRLRSGSAEFDRVVGGGLVYGSAVLIGGDPGIGKSTLVLQIMAALANSGVMALYISGEEAIDQVRLRSQRLGLSEAPVALAASTHIEVIIGALKAKPAPDVLVIDSIQTMYCEALDAAPGTVGQVRASAHALIEAAKRTGCIVMLIGHVTKDGMIAGPRVLEHMVDAVLYFEGERGHAFRILRAVKNRFGATDEIGIFAMTDRGLIDVPNPSALFLAERTAETQGSVVFAGIEGTRPVLLEIQALVAPSSLSSPRRAVVGWDASRLAMVVAVLEARCGLRLAANDLYLNVTGGLKIAEPAADLAVAAALISAFLDVPLPPEQIIFGEIGLSGEIRQVAQADLRLKEAERLGFKGAILPASAKPASGKKNGAAATHLTLTPIATLKELVRMLQADAVPRARFGAAKPMPQDARLA